MVSTLFNYRDDLLRLVNAARVVLSLILLSLLAAVLPAGEMLSTVSYTLCLGYLAFAVWTAAFGTRTWWIRAQSGPINAVADGSMIFVLLLTKGGLEAFAFPLSLLLVASSDRCLGPRGFVSLGIGLTALMLLIGGALGFVPIDLWRFLPYSLMLVFFLSSLALFFDTVERKNELSGESDTALLEVIHESELPLAMTLKRIVAAFDADNVIYGWRDRKSEWGRLVHYALGKSTERCCTREEFSQFLRLGIESDDSFLFDGAQGRIFACRGDRYMERIQVDPFARQGNLQLSQGFCIPIDCQMAVGRLFVIRDRPFQGNEFPKARAARLMLERTLDRFEHIEAVRNSSFTRARRAIGRNIHDGILQNLAGLGMHFAAIKLDLTAGRLSEALPRLDKLQTLVESTQLELRALIHGEGQREEDRLNAVPILRELAQTLKSQWNIECSFSAFPDPILIPSQLGPEIAFLIREATANAVKHACAHWVRISVAATEDVIRLLVASDCNGESVTCDTLRQPRSLYKRAEGLGGTILFKKERARTYLTAYLPARGA